MIVGHQLAQRAGDEQLELTPLLVPQHHRPPRQQPSQGISSTTPSQSHSGLFQQALPVGISLRFRYFGPHLLIEDNTIRSRETALFNGRVGYNVENRVSVSLDVLNLTNSRSDRHTYAYVSRLSRERDAGLIDRHFHSVEPTAVRLTIAGRS